MYPISETKQQFLVSYVKSIYKGEIIPLKFFRKSLDSIEFFFRHKEKENITFRKLIEISYNNAEDGYKTYISLHLKTKSTEEHMTGDYDGYISPEILPGAFCLMCSREKENNDVVCCLSCWKTFIENKYSEAWKQAHKKCKNSGKKCLECGAS